MELHEEVVGRRSPIDVQHRKRHVRVLRHGTGEVAHLVGDRLQGRPHDMGAPGAAGEAENSTASVGIPPGGAQARERGHDEDAVGSGHAAGDGVGCGDAVDDAELVAEPLDESTGHEHAALERVLGALDARGRGGHRGHEAVLARAGLMPGVHEQKAAGAVGVLRLARMEAALAEERRLLVARHAADGNALDKPRVRRHAEAARRRAHLGKDGLGDAE